jgi:hypothetical protein
MTGDTVPTFTPPVVLEPAETRHPLFSRVSIPVGVSVLKSASGGYQALQNPTPEQIDAAAIAYLGGRDYVILEDEAASLMAAGYEVTP